MVDPIKEHRPSRGVVNTTALVNNHRMGILRG